MNIKLLKLFAFKFKPNITCAVESTWTWIRLFVRQIGGTYYNRSIVRRRPSE